MNQKCSIQECSKDAVKFCNCQNKQIYYCEIHIKFHEKDKNHNTIIKIFINCINTTIKALFSNSVNSNNS